MFALLILWGKILGSLLVLFLLAGIWWVYFQKGSLSVTVGTSGFPFFLPFRLRRKILRSMHIHCMGTSGYGKSTFAANYVTELILQGQAVSVIDPHNDLSDLILQNLWDRGCFNQPNWQKKVWYIEFNRKDRFVPWNILQTPYTDQVIAENIFDALTRSWDSLAEGHAPLLENIVDAGVPVLTKNNRTFPDLYDLLTKKEYRHRLLQSPGVDPLSVKYFLEQYEALGKEQADKRQSTLTRVFLLCHNHTLRFSLGQKDNLLDQGYIMDQGISVLYNLGGENLSKAARRHIGALLCVSIEQATLARASTPVEKRKPYVVLIDEFSQFVSSAESVQTFLSESRKMRVTLVLLHQTWTQLSERLKGALQNAIDLFFRLGYEDSVWAAPRMMKHDNYIVKEEVPDEQARERTHKLYFTIPEKVADMAHRIETLAIGEAFIKVPVFAPKLLHGLFPNLFPKTRTVKLWTRNVTGSAKAKEAIKAIKEASIQTLMRPLDEILKEMDEEENNRSVQAEQNVPRRSPRRSKK